MQEIIRNRGVESDYSTPRLSYQGVLTATITAVRRDSRCTSCLSTNHSLGELRFIVFRNFTCGKPIINEMESDARDCRKKRRVLTPGSFASAHCAV